MTMKTEGNRHIWNGGHSGHPAFRWNETQTGDEPYISEIVDGLGLTVTEIYRAIPEKARDDTVVTGTGIQHGALLTIDQHL